LIKCVRALAAVLAIGALCAAPSQAFAQKSLSLLRDAEIENTLRKMGTPLWVAAGLEPSSIHLYLVKDNTLNAFVAGGKNIFFHTGLLLKVKRASELIGVIAHETGHIAGGHLARSAEAVENASTSALIGALLGGAIALSTGRADVGAVVFQGGTSVATSSLLQFSRTQESAADQAAVRFMNDAHETSKGLLDFLAVLGDQELLSPQYQDAYARTHPISRDRIDQLAVRAKASPYYDTPTPPELEEELHRMQAKLYAFLNRPASTMIVYKKSDTSIAARYARAIALYRKPDLENALVAVNALIADEPHNPYFLELKGQMLFENGRVKEAIAPYRASVSYAPNDAPLRVGLARSLIESEDPANLKPAIENLHAALRREPDDSFAWRQLAIAYGRDGQLGMSALAQAEEAALQRRVNDAIGLAEKAMRLLPKGSPAWLRAQDIKQSPPKRPQR